MIPELYKNEDGNFIIFSNDAIAQHIKKGKQWEPHFKTVISYFIKPGDTVIDAGANFGYNGVLMGKQIGPKGTLISFEPQRIIYQQMCGNLIINSIYNAVAIQAALGDGSVSSTTMAPVDYNLDWVNIGDTSIGNGGEQVDVYKLDDLLVDNINFIKLDVQGYELFTLKGAENHIKTFQPDLFIEIEDHQLIKFNITSNQLIDYIKFLGYRIFKINNEYPCDHICTINNIDKIKELELVLPIIEI
jgi:FkbM family methyltransferase